MSNIPVMKSLELLQHNWILLQERLRGSPPLVLPRFEQVHQLVLPVRFRGTHLHHSCYIYIKKFAKKYFEKRGI